ncbi:MAG TPA: molybdopterin-dependent oxidoreductase [Desulfitobacterium dehalogenans]|uniref:Molybdopterin-dependent oxidoreductase n=1 Tax=Desulfitobacterium dehalogenans TaxID=36854 RepID=A0A7C6Z297_9FIRM|nr:molybdopterin-dependent oxidoreductase [Desulfitobacterium dehalogenans]
MMRISRRDFIKGGAAGTATLGLSGSLFFADRWLRPATAASDPEERIAYTYHPPGCGGRCAYQCTVRDGKLVKIEPNDWPDHRYSLICTRGLSELQRVYSPDRLQTPLKRVGERGEGKFVPISWDEAITTVADKFKELHSQYGGKSILKMISANQEYSMPLLSSLLGIPIALETSIDTGIASGVEEVTGDSPFGYAMHEITDWVNAKTILLVACNILETTVADSQFFFDAQEAGAKIIVIDPNYSTTATKADQWIPLRPGSDPALLLAMINYILEKDWYQHDFMEKNTSAPFLIRSDNQHLLRQNDSADGPEQNPFMIWDGLSNLAQPYNATGIQPQLEGEFTVNGIKVKTVMSVLKEQMKHYTPAWAAEMTEIPEQTIIDLAQQYAQGGPAYLGWGFGGAEKISNSDIFGHAAAILGSLTGNFGRVGGGVGNALFHKYHWGLVAKLGAWSLPAQFKSPPMELPTTLMGTQPNSVKAVLNLGNSFQQHFANFHRAETWLKQLEFVVTVDIFDNASVAYSDIVLPIGSCFESNYEITRFQLNRNHALLSEKVIEPLFESKSDFEIEQLLATRLGFAEYMPKTPEDYIRAQLNSPDPFLKGITVETLKANKFIMRLNCPTEPCIGHQDQKYKTPSGKLEIYNETMIEFAQALPAYEEPAELNSVLRQNYPLQFAQYRSRFHVHSQFMRASWIRQFCSEPRLELNPLDAKNRGLANGDLVEVFNDRGKLKARCKFMDSLRPGSVRMEEGWWSKDMPEGDINYLTNDTFNPRGFKRKYGPIIPFYDTLVEVKKA